VQQNAELLGGDARAHTVLYSTRILKKTGLRLSSTRGPSSTGNPGRR
jgi:hypothetical protein